VKTKIDFLLEIIYIHRTMKRIAQFVFLVFFCLSVNIVFAQQQNDPYYNFANGVVGLAFEGLATDFIEMTFDPSLINSELKQSVDQLMKDVGSVNSDEVASFTVLMDNCDAPSRCYYTFIIYKATGKSLAEVQIRFFDEQDFLIDDFNIISKSELEAVREDTEKSPIRF